MHHIPFSATPSFEIFPHTGTFSPDLRRELWEELTGRDQEVVDFDHFLAALRGVRVTQKSAPAPVPPDTATSTTGPTTGALPLPLPISRRQHGAALSMGLPIKARNLELFTKKPNLEFRPCFVGKDLEK